MATTSSSFAKKGNVAAYPRERQSLRRSKSSGESTPNLKRSRGPNTCGRTLDAVSAEDLNDFIVTLKEGGLSPNTVLHNVIIIIAQFCKRSGRSGITTNSIDGYHLPGQARVDWINVKEK